MRLSFLIGLILFAILLLPLGCLLVAAVLNGLGVFDQKHDEDEAMRRWLETNAERRDWAIGDQSHEQRR
jgi:hypothetical protein